ncbi:hypothetical protein MC885_005657 [Smutsia gigantea]|nr:hypothetical protein MC885_005657 [Smutsia gigantea]
MLFPSWGETSSCDREKLRAVSLEAKCQGITLFVLALGQGVGAREPVDLAHVVSAPPEQHRLCLEGVSDADVAYARAFTRTFLNLLKSCPRARLAYLALLMIWKHLE